MLLQEMKPQQKKSLQDKALRCWNPYSQQCKVGVEEEHLHNLRKVNIPIQIILLQNVCCSASILYSLLFQKKRTFLLYWLQHWGSKQHHFLGRKGAQQMEFLLGLRGKEEEAIQKLPKWAKKGWDSTQQYDQVRIAVQIHLWMGKNIIKIDNKGLIECTPNHS